MLNIRSLILFVICIASLKLFLPYTYVIGLFVFFTIVFSVAGIFDVEKEQFHFEVTPQKRCNNWDYLTTSDPELRAYCQGLSSAEISQYVCPAGYNGAPVHFEYTPETDAEYRNQRCNQPFTYNQQVL
jgi:hypothetical protein